MAATVDVWSKWISPEDELAWEEKLELQAAGRFVIVRRKGRKQLLVQVYVTDLEESEQLKERFGGTVESVSPDDWSGARPEDQPILVKIRDRLIVTSESDPAALRKLREAYPQRAVLTIPAELAFGTGDHETTATCLRFLVDVASERRAQMPGWRLMDLGTGTGVLAIAAKHLGADRVLGCENDPLAVTVAQKNVLQNGFQSTDVEIAALDVFEWEPQEDAWDVITANMFSEILIATFPKIRRALKPNGTLIISGILEQQAGETLEAAKASGFQVDVVKQVGKWVTARTA